MEKINKFYNRDECRYLTHDYHPYPHKIVPQIAKVLIEKYSEVGDIILDCFCGSGTSLLEANLLGRNAIGVDVNPLACLIAKVKTNIVDFKKLEVSNKLLMSEVKFHLKRDGTLADYTDRIKPKFPEFQFRDKWFTENALLGLSVIKSLIRGIENKNTQDFCMVAFSCTVKDVSNAASFYRLTKAKGLRHVSLSRIAHLFNSKLKEMEYKMQQIRDKEYCSYINIYQLDARYINFEEIDFVLCNIPRFNMDFERSFKIYSWWLDYDVALVNKKIIGTMKRKEEYYKDIKLVLQNIYRMLRLGKYCAILITDSYDNGNHLKHGDVVENIGLEIGFTLHEKYVRTIPKKVLPFATKDRREDVLVFRKV